MNPETIAIHAPRRRDGAVAPSISLSTTFEHGPANEMLHDHAYIRASNPNVCDLESRLAAVEGGAGAVAYASGMAAGAGLLSTLKPGSRVVFHNNLYYDFKRLSAEILPDWGVEGVFVDMRHEAALAAALSEETALLFFETPSNPGLDVIDIECMTSLAKAVGAKTLVDNTFATPAIQKPLDHGADYVMHSLTKYMGGHSDVQGGAIIVRDGGDIDTLRNARTITGGVLAPFNAWLVSRGLQTLHCRMQKHCANAAALAETLDAHSAVECVRYPFLKSNPSREMAMKQMTAGGGMVSVEIKGGREAALKVAGALKLFINATSLGGVESLVEHRASVERGFTDTPEGLLRLSVGLEHIDDLKDDFAEALAAL